MTTTMMTMTTTLATMIATARRVTGYDDNGYYDGGGG